ncbi:MAG TPA: molybdopterin-dependent oxidoreductase [Terriglobales bacterium]|nr:molybdopterin-dependent oxidoreductase [Terriglobales bacterium]
MSLTRPSLLFSRLPSAVSSPASLKRDQPASDNLYDSSLYTACHQCDQQCAEIAYLKNNVLVKLDGNPDDPQCAGKLCPKGQAAIMDLYNPNRLKVPLVRTNPQKGLNVDPKWTQVSWSDAFDTIASKFKDIISQYGAQAIAGQSQLQLGDLQSFFKAIGSPNTFQCGATCYYSCMAPQAAVMGNTFHQQDLIQGTTKYVILFSNVSETIENPNARQVVEAQAGGAKIVVFDPRMSASAAKADLWVPIVPGTDQAAVLAMINVIVTKELYNADFVNNFTSGFDQLSTFIQQYTPEWAEPITGIPAVTLRQIAEEFATQVPSAALFRRGPAKSRGQYWKFVHAWAILNSLVGSIDVRGTVTATRGASLEYVGPPQNPPSPYSLAVDSREKLLPTPGGVWDGGLRSTGTSDSLADSALNGPYPAKALIAAGANWIGGSPNTATWIKALSNTFVLVLDYQMTDTAWFADVLLPVPTFLERNEIATPMYSIVPTVYARQSVVASLYDTKTEIEIWHEIGSRLGVEQYINPYGTDVLDSQLKPLGISFDQLKAKGIFQVRQDFTPIRKFQTPSGKIELYSTNFKNAGFDPLPTWTESPIKPTSDYPTYFVSFDEATNSLTKTAGNPWLSELFDNGLWINSDTANNLGINDGDGVVVESPYGKITAKASLTERIRTDTVALAHGRGYSSSGADSWARRGVSESPLTRPSTVQDHLDWYQNKDEPFGISRYMDFTVKVSKA